MVERRNRVIKAMLIIFCEANPKQWDQFLGAFLFAIRNAPREGLPYSPLFLLYERELRSPLEVFLSLDYEAPLYTADTWALHMLHNLRLARSLTVTHLTKVHDYDK